MAVRCGVIPPSEGTDDIVGPFVWGSRCMAGVPRVLVYTFLVLISFFMWTTLGGLRGRLTEDVVADMRREAEVDGDGQNRHTELANHELMLTMSLGQNLTEAELQNRIGHCKKPDHRTNYLDERFTDEAVLIKKVLVEEEPFFLDGAGLQASSLGQDAVDEEDGVQTNENEAPELMEFEQYDRDTDGFIVAAEFDIYFEGSDSDLMISEFDVDGDGQINREEFALLKCFWYEGQYRAHCEHAEEPRESWLDGE